MEQGAQACIVRPNMRIDFGVRSQVPRDNTLNLARPDRYVPQGMDWAFWMGFAWMPICTCIMLFLECSDC